MPNSQIGVTAQMRQDNIRVWVRSPGFLRWCSWFHRTRPGVPAAQSAALQRGATLAEMMTVLAVAGVLLAGATTVSITWSGREAARRASYDVRTYFQLARAHAVSRNRACRVLLNTASGALQVWDLNDPAISGDDIRLAAMTLSNGIKFQRPDLSTPVTMSLVSGTIYEAVFAQDGTVTSGAGVVSIKAMDRFDQVTLYGAGGTKLERWNGSAWVMGA